jgi:hypothetical protein
MDETTIRERAEAHSQAVVDRDFGKAGGDLTGNAEANAADVMKQLPRPTTSAEVTSVETRGDEVVCHIRYGGEGAETTVVSTWRDVDGTPRIVEFAVAD